MTELQPPAGMSLAAAVATLQTAFDTRDASERESDRTYLDTFDGLLRADGLTLVHEDGRLVLSAHDDARELAVATAPLPPGPLRVGALPEGPLRSHVQDSCGVRALLPLVHLHCRVRALAVLDDERKTVVRLAVEEPAVVEGVSRHAALAPRVRLIGLRGYETELNRVRDRLETELGFTAAGQPLVDEAVRAAGGVPGGISSKVAVPLVAGARSDEAAAAVCRRLLEVITANLDGALADLDSEFLHDLRVSVRRTRSVQRQLKHIFPPDRLAHFRAEFKWLQQATGDARDLDVYVLDFDEFRGLVPEAAPGALDVLLGVLETRRRAAHAEMVTALRSSRYTALVAGWGELLDRLALLPSFERPGAGRPIETLVGERIVKVYRRIVTMGRAVDAESPAEDLHELRKKGKELRYLLELFGTPLYPEEIVAPMVKRLKALQNVLGRHQDREVQQGMIHGLRDDVAARPGGPAALIAMGLLLGRLAEDERAARSEFAKRFAAFADKDQRRLVKETFSA